jgi:RNA-directed DNA polymerase
MIYKSALEGNILKVRKLQNTLLIRFNSKLLAVKGVNSIYDDNSDYCEQRLFSHPKLSQNRKKLLRKQKGLCTYCKKHLNTEDIMENHHIIPQNIGGKNTRSNLQLIHGHCHDKIHASKPSDMLN